MKTHHYHDSLDVICQSFVPTLLPKGLGSCVLRQHARGAMRIEVDRRQTWRWIRQKHHAFREGRLTHSSSSTVPRQCVRESVNGWGKYVAKVRDAKSNISPSAIMTVFQTNLPMGPKIHVPLPWEGRVFPHNPFRGQNRQAWGPNGVPALPPYYISLPRQFSPHFSRKTLRNPVARDGSKILRRG